MAKQASGRAQRLAYLVSQAEPYGDFLLAPACPIEKVVFLVYTPGSQTDKGFARQIFAQTGNRARDSRSKAQYTIH